MTNFRRALLAILIAVIGTVGFSAGLVSAHHPVLTSTAARPCGADAQWTATFTATSDADYNKDWQSKFHLDAAADNAYSAYTDDQVAFGPIAIGPFAASKASVLVTVTSHWASKPTHNNDQVTETRNITINRPTATTCPPVQTTPGVTFTDPTCANQNTASVSGQLNTDKVTYTQTGTVAPGGSVTVSAAPKTGYTFTPNPTVFTHTFPAAADCRTISTPVAPTVTRSAECGVKDTFTAGPTVGVVYSVTSGTLDQGQVVQVIATPAQGYKFAGESQSVTFTIEGGAVEVCETTTVPTTTPPTTVPPTTVPTPCVYDTSLPADSPLCVPPTIPTTVPPTAPPTTVVPPVLPATGKSHGGELMFASILVVAGMLATAATRRRKNA